MTTNTKTPLSDIRQGVRTALDALILCEKPDSANRIAAALSSTGRPKKRFVRGVPIFEISDPGRIVVCSAAGHFYTVHAKRGSTRKHFPVFDFTWTPRYLVEKKCARQKVWLDVIEELSRNVKTIVNACDYDMEGSLIGAMILRHACGGADRKAKRMKFSTLTETEIRKSFQSLLPKLDFGTIDAAMCRHEIDWLYGINLSRILTESALRRNRHYFTLSTGRVQAPTLRFVVKREEDICSFTATSYWAIEAKIDLGGKRLHVQFEKEQIPGKEEAEKIVSTCARTKNGQVSGKQSRTLHLRPPPPFDLPSLQRESYEHFRFNPSQTLSVAEKLYLSALISYPRTSSQKLPPSIGYRNILGDLSKISSYAHAANKLLSRIELRPSNGVKTDPAHPAIYPTGRHPERLTSPEQKIFDLIVRRYLSTFADSAIREIQEVYLKFDNHTFVLNGAKTLFLGWTEFCEPHEKLKDLLLPDINVGQTVHLASIKAIQRYTKPPPRYNQSSLLNVMEKSNLGTKATRASIIETLYRRRYIQGNQISATKLGISVTSVLERHCPTLLDEKFTRKLEYMIQDVENGHVNRANVVLKAVTQLKSIISALRLHEHELEQELSDSMQQVDATGAELTPPCPQCGAKLRIVRSARTRKRFIKCLTESSRCGFTLPIPQRGDVRPLAKKCRICGFQLMQVRERCRRWVTCPLCYLRKRTTSE